MKTAKAKKVFAPIRVPAKASFYYTVAALIGRLFGFLFTPIFTRSLTAAEYGIFPLYLGWLSLFSAASTLEIGTGAILGGFTKFKNEPENFMKSALFTLVSAFLTLSLPILLFSSRVSALTGLDKTLLPIMAVHALSDAIISLYLTEARYRYSYYTVFLFNVIPSLLTPLTGLFLIRLSPSLSRPLGAMLISVIALLPILIKWKPWSGIIRWEMVRFTVRTCLALFPASLGAILIAGADRLMIGYVLGKDAVAKYSVAHSLGLALTFFTVGLYGALKPWIMRKIDRGEKAAVAVVSYKLLLLGAAATLALLCVAPEILSILAPRTYSDALAAVYPLALAVLPMFLYNVFSSVLIFTGRGRRNSLFAVLAAGINIALNAILLPRFGITAAAISFFTSYAVLALITAFTAKEHCFFETRAWLFLLLTLLLGIMLYILKGALHIRYAVLILLIPSAVGSAFDIFSLIRERESSEKTCS